MMIIRPITMNDLPALMQLAASAGKGLTTLPADDSILATRIKASQQAMADPPTRPGGEQFFFVMEDFQHGEIVGCSAIVNKVGGFQPFYTYEINTAEKQCDTLGVKKRIEYLQLKEVHDGPSEVGTLFLSPDARKGLNGKLLSLSRFLFIASYRSCFEDELVAEMRGQFNAQGKSEFWEALGRHFFDVDFETADHMVMDDKSFIAHLMPRHPIYLPLLPPAAQAVVGKVHKETGPALAMLEREGFSFANEIDIFEAGPVYRCKTDEVRTIASSMVRPFVGVVDEAVLKQGDEMLVATQGEMEAYRAIIGHVYGDQDGVYLSEAMCDALHVKNGDQLRLAPLPSRRKSDVN